MTSPPRTISRSGNFTPHHVESLPRRTTPKPLNFRQAMSDFRTMFPELDNDVIETVLRANNGVVQSTIDQLLVLQESTIAENDKSKNTPLLPSYEHSIGMDGEEPPPPYNDVWQDVASPPPDQTDFPLYANVAKSKMKSGRFWNAPMVGRLPDDFLRLAVKKDCKVVVNSRPPGRNINTTVDDFMTDEEIERFLEDEKLAMFLQNEEFLRELRRNQEFVTSLEADHQQAVLRSDDNASISSAVSTGKTPNSHGGARPRTTQPTHARMQSQNHTHDDVAFRHKLRHMGQSTKKKFGKIAKRFSRTRNATRFTPALHSSESTFNLLEEEAATDEQRMGLDGIESEESETETEHKEYKEDVETEEYEGDIETEVELENKIRPRPVSTRRQLPQPGTGRQLPKPPESSQSSGTDEPIVFYSEDNEFEYKID